MNTELFVIKADGTEEPFAPEKLATSLSRAGASAAAQEHIIDHISDLLRKEVMPTEKIYKRAFEMLKKREKPVVAARYSVKRAVFALGPSGYPFERFLAEVLRSHGWRTENSVILQGKCVEHEIDVLAEKNGKRVGIEAKFHNNSGIKTDVKDALYVHARYKDLAATTDDIENAVTEGWLVTNTHFTHQAIQYGECVGLPMIGWDYPRSGNLMELIEEGQVHPLTCLTSLSDPEKQRLLDNKIVLCRSVGTNEQVLREHGVHPETIKKVQEEARQLCGI